MNRHQEEPGLTACCEMLPPVFADIAEVKGVQASSSRHEIVRIAKSLIVMIRILPGFCVEIISISQRASSLSTIVP
jgi:hypothetical protein